jgi:hypothetical protein
MYLAAFDIRRPKMRQGTIDVDGFVHWKNEPREHSRITWITQRIDRDGKELPK